MTEPYYVTGTTLIYHGDCIEVLRELPAESVDAVVTDPPYNLGFMGRAWDTLGGEFQQWCEQWSRECLRVLRPGGYMLAFGGTRTWHRLACGVEDAGFELRDSIAWLYSSGFPKSLDVSKAIDKRLGATRTEVIRHRRDGAGNGSVVGLGSPRSMATEYDELAPATDEARQWQGWGTALKPAFEPIVVARKPLDGTVADNVLQHGTGALNIDACRVGESGGCHRTVFNDTGRNRVYGAGLSQATAAQPVEGLGRWPTNVALDEGQAAELGGAARYFPAFTYQAKAQKRERPVVDGVAHPTVKPVALMRWLVRLVARPGGVVLDPFAGSGATVEACAAEGVRCVAVELEADYLPLIVSRLSGATA